jgi:hypothetical protein
MKHRHVFRVGKRPVIIYFKTKRTDTLRASTDHAAFVAQPDVPEMETGFDGTVKSLKCTAFVYPAKVYARGIRRRLGYYILGFSR